MSMMRKEIDSAMMTCNMGDSYSLEKLHITLIGSN